MTKICSECGKEVKFLDGRYCLPQKGKEIFLCNDCLKKVKDVRNFRMSGFEFFGLLGIVCLINGLGFFFVIQDAMALSYVFIILFFIFIAIALVMKFREMRMKL